MSSQALVWLSNKKISTPADVDHFIANWRITVFFSNCVWPNLFSHFAAFNCNGHWSTYLRVDDFFIFSETRACLWTRWLELLENVAERVSANCRTNKTKKEVCNTPSFFIIQYDTNEHGNDSVFYRAVEQERE